VRKKHFVLKYDCHLLRRAELKNKICGQLDSKEAYGGNGEMKDMHLKRKRSQSRAPPPRMITLLASSRSIRQFTLRKARLSSGKLSGKGNA